MSTIHPSLTVPDVKQLHDHVAPGITLVSAENLQEWFMDIKVLDDNPIYNGQTYRLKFVFNSNYPIGMFLKFVSLGLDS